MHEWKLFVWQSFDLKAICWEMKCFISSVKLILPYIYTMRVCLSAEGPKTISAPRMGGGFDYGIHWQVYIYIYIYIYTYIYAVVHSM